MKKVTMTMLRAQNPTWFSKSNKRFFNDLSYRVLYSKQTKRPFLVRETTGFSDMFGGQKLTFVVVNEINPDLSIGNMIELDPQGHRFYSIEQVKNTYLKYI